jgi:hypothetical protein
MEIYLHCPTSLRDLVLTEAHGELNKYRRSRDDALCTQICYRPWLFDLDYLSVSRNTARNREAVVVAAN